jgi:hypothetical protein
LKTSFSLKDIDSYKKRIYKVLDTCKMTSYYSINTIDNDILRWTSIGKHSIVRKVCVENMLFART